MHPSRDTHSTQLAFPETRSFKHLVFKYHQSVHLVPKTHKAATEGGPETERKSRPRSFRDSNTTIIADGLFKENKEETERL